MMSSSKMRFRANAWHGQLSHAGARRSTAKSLLMIMLIVAAGCAQRQSPPPADPPAQPVYATPYGGSPYIKDNPVTPYQIPGNFKDSAVVEAYLNKLLPQQCFSGLLLYQPKLLIQNNDMISSAQIFETAQFGGYLVVFKIQRLEGLFSWRMDYQGWLRGKIVWSDVQP